MRVSADLTEGLALVAIGLAVLFGGGALLHALRAFEPAAVALLGLGILGLAVSMRRVTATPNARLALTVRAAYVTGLALAIVAVVLPQRWSSGAAIAMIVIAIAFDIFVRVTRTQVH